MNKEKIIEIAKFRGIDELACKKCGVVSALESITYEFNGPKVRADCPDCGAFIKFMPTVKSWRIFRSAKYGMVEIEKLDNGFLDWYLRTVTKINPDLRRNIEELIARRTTDPAAFYVPPLDIDTDKIAKLIERQKYLVENVIIKKDVARRKVADHDPDADHGATKKLENFLGANYLIIKDYEKELRRVRKNIAKIETE